jgi:hypothetical protein
MWIYQKFALGTTPRAGWGNWVGQKIVVSNSPPFPHPGGIDPCLISPPPGGEGVGNFK